MIVFWFRRDLRLNDNCGLYHALRAGESVLPLFIFDRRILSELEDKDDPRVSFLLDEVSRLKSELEMNGSSLKMLFGEPIDIIEGLAASHPVTAVFANHDYEPYARDRDEAVSRMLAGLGVSFHTYKDQVIFDKDDVMKAPGSPYTVFTPYMKKWKSLFRKEMLIPFPSELHGDKFIRTDPYPSITIGDLGFTRSPYEIPSRKVDPEILKNYDKTRDFPSLPGTSRMSVHLRFGTVSIRQLFASALEWNEKYMNELIWREFYKMILWHFPHVANRSFKPRYDLIRWRNNEREFEAWCSGKTGIPIVDAGIRELNATGFMHNRLRMITASFLTKQLLIDWRWGEAYFARKLMDYDLSSNNGGWQWAAGTGVDAAPYFRIFNPLLQAERFDPDGSYVKSWVPESANEHYIKPIVDVRAARERALKVYAEALK